MKIIIKKNIFCVMFDLLLKETVNAISCDTYELAACPIHF